MSRYRYRKRKQLVAEINVVPYIDVMLVLLVIFMVTAPILTQGVKVDLPEAVSAPLDIKEDDLPLIVAVKKTGEYFLEIGVDKEQAIKASELSLKVSKITRQNPNVQVLVRGDKSASYGAVVQLMGILQQAGAKNIGLLSQPPEK
ncbi:Cell division and transport-associated protein TolR [Oceanospirillum multiglobuliferum]|uniref:Tol-Pal system protein TolR n=1 Tax=Oceanospirillum multiglobuliferum TaxID=64969 RepID=A0A1T4RQ11_9GAMM|nr:protein TolR [Oceanospirillum multiglobuliferum]OPX54678.1 protein TolR [Oceanospirillum multiglobuliferum]SKA18089.1 Cell division and transport-associated protein TolR [Oceanospirillum multiglobuliferum]